MSNTPTEKQAQRLRILANGCIIPAPGRRDWMPLLRREWVETTGDAVPDEGSYLPPLRITSAGLRALADALDAGRIEAATIKPGPTA